MQLYRAETGCHATWDSADIIDSLDVFKDKVKQHTGIEIDRQILMTSFGTQVKESNVKEVTTASGPDEYIVFVYDREYLSASEEQVLELIDDGTPRLEPELRQFHDATAHSALDKVKEVQNTNLGYTCKLYMSLFAHFDTCAQSLKEVVTIHTRLARRVAEEQKHQCMALNVAMTNLESHNTIANQSVVSFSTHAQKELAKQSTLAETADTNIRILKNIRIHPAILDAIGEVRAERTLLDYLDMEELETSKIGAREFCTTLERELQELQNGATTLHHRARELQQQIADNQDPQSLDAGVSDVRGLQEQAHFLSEHINRNANRVFSKISRLINIPIASLTNQIPDIADPALLLSPSSPSSASALPTTDAREQFKMIYDLATMYLNEEIPKMITYEQRARHKLVELIAAKRKSIVRFLENMHRVSELQSDIANVMSYVESMRKWITDFKRTEAGRTLEIAEEVIYAYAYLLLELARRKEYSAVLLENANATADLLASYRTKEQKRRDRFLRKYIGMLPFEITVFEDDTTPHCEISTAHLECGRPEITRNDVIDFVRILGQHYTPPQSRPESSRLSITNRRRPSPASSKIGKLALEESISSRSNRSQLQDSTVIGGSEKFIDLLHAMSQELDGLKADFLKAVETTFFSSADDSRPSELSGKVPREKALISFNASQIELQQKSRALDHAEERLKNYEERIASLEKALQNSYRIESSAKAKNASSAADHSSGSSSQYSLVDETSNNRELRQIQDTLKEQERYINDLQKQMHTEQEMWENEREDFKLQLQELESLLEEERQTYEYNRRSLLKEAQVKDDLADMRVASLEEDYKTKIQELQALVDKERQTHQQEMEERNREIKKLSDSNRTYAEEQALALEELDQLKKEYAEYRSETEKRLQELDNTEKARDNIKQQLAKARDMVSRAESDWMSKQEALENALGEQKDVRVALEDLVSLYGRLPEETDIPSLLESLKACMESASSNQINLEEHLADVDHDYDQLSADMRRLDDEHKELRLLTTHMAERLEGFRKDILYELTHQLQLSVNEEEAMTITKRIIVSDQDDDMAVWNNVLQAAKGVDPTKFVNRVREKIREAHELTRRWKRDYKELKEKYSKLSSNSRDKIAFRNFQVGDVALFLPTRNSTGKPWAAFNINAPHYFLKPSESVELQMQQREWMVARIITITEYTASSDPQSNPYRLAEGLIYYQLEVENWRSVHHRKSHHKNQSRKADGGSSKSKEKDSAYTMIPKSPPAQDTGLASLGESSTAAPSSPSHGRPTFPLSHSTSNVVHSYVPTNSPPSSRERRHSYFGQDHESSSISPTLAWTQAHE